MPLIAYACKNGHVIKKSVRQAKDAPAHLPCAECDLKSVRQLGAPSSASKIVMDNGHQARAVEITPNIVEINEARANKDYRNED